MYLRKVYADINIYAKRLRYLAWPSFCAHVERKNGIYSQISSTCCVYSNNLPTFMAELESSLENIYVYVKIYIHKHSYNYIFWFVTIIKLKMYPTAS